MKKEENVKRVVKILCFVICFVRFVLSKLTYHEYFILNGFINEKITKWILIVGKY